MVEDLFNNKLNSDDPFFKWCLTPDIDEGGWVMLWRKLGDEEFLLSRLVTQLTNMYSTVDTLGYKFSYPWGRESWGDYDCWDDAHENIIKGLTELYEIAQHLNINYNVVFLSVNGDDRGYLSCKFFELDDIAKYGGIDNFCRENAGLNIVLFVYGLTEGDMELYVAH